MIKIPIYVLRILSEHRHLDDRVDMYVRQGIEKNKAYDTVVDEVKRWTGVYLPYSSSASYWVCRNRKEREFKKILGKK